MIDPLSAVDRGDDMDCITFSDGRYIKQAVMRHIFCVLDYLTIDTLLSEYNS
jgi:hypothetical protein